MESTLVTSVLALLELVLPVVVVIVAVNWVAGRGQRARARGFMALSEGRIVDALEAFTLCQDRLVLTGRAKLWLWRLPDALEDLQHALHLDPARFRDTAEPLVALVHALWAPRLAYASGHLVEGQEPRLARAAHAARARKWPVVVQALEPLQVTDNPRAAALRDVLLAWARTELDGVTRPIDGAAVLGEGAITAFDEGFPALAKILRDGQVAQSTVTAPPQDPTRTPSHSGA
ncbi:MAG: hypothetical protein K1X89_08025 [Myxococcaceae bacterium]|nr:hypothetical protein [Myxococcaceae bacterium]